ncbi:hypothetical protein SBADM41S_03698 [Streptomyces badius]
MLQEVVATRYVTPLREGGSLPGIVEADDLGTYVMKFTGAGQGRKTLVAEIICGELSRRLGLRVPELVTIELDPVIGLAEPDQEVQELLKASGGLNLGMDYLPGSFGFDPLAYEVGVAEAGRVVWFDALINNVDRSWRNPNLLVWHGDLWLIDHGATMIWHHNWPGAQASAAKPYNASDHVLAPFGPDIAAAAASSPRWSPRSCSPRSPPMCRTSGWPASPVSTPPTRCAGPMSPRCSRGPRPSTSGSHWTRPPRPGPPGPGLAHGPAAAPAEAGRGRRPRRGGRRVPARRAADDAARCLDSALRVVPRSSGGMLDAGVLVYCRAHSFVAARTYLDEAKLKALDPDADVVGVRAAAPSKGSAAAVRRRARRRATTPVGDRWLIAPRSTVVQPGAVPARPPRRRGRPPGWTTARPVGGPAADLVVAEEFSAPLVWAESGLRRMLAADVRHGPPGRRRIDAGAGLLGVGLLTRC